MTGLLVSRVNLQENLQEMASPLGELFCRIFPTQPLETRASTKDELFIWTASEVFDAITNADFFIASRREPPTAFF